MLSTTSKMFAVSALAGAVFALGTLFFSPRAEAESGPTRCIDGRCCNSWGCCEGNRCWPK